VSYYKHQSNERRHLGQCNAQLPPQVRVSAAWYVAAKPCCHGRKKHEHEHHGEILDDQPADGDSPVHGLQNATGLKRPQRNRQRQTENHSASCPPSPCSGNARAESSGDTHLYYCPGQGDLADRQQVVQREVQSNPEHEQHHANLGELPRDFDIGHETGGGRADEDTGQ
jgi:hypothetical protein